MSIEARIEYAKTKDGVSIAYTSIGQGPTVVCSTNNTGGDLHLYGTGATPWFEQLAAGGRRVVLYDGRGAGSSDRDAIEEGLENRVADLESVVDKLGLERFALLGRYHGGAQAVAYAVRHPEKLSHLVLWDTYASGAAYYSATPYTRAIKALLEVAAEDWELFTLTLAHWATGFRDPERARTMGAGFQSGMTAQYYLNLVANAQATDVTPMLASVAVPTLVIQDQWSVISTPSTARVLASAIPSAQSISVRGAEAGVRAVIDFTATTVEASSAPQILAPGGTRTVLFTDIVGHTEMMQRLGDAKGRDVLREHERITRETLKAHGGAEVKTMGDGFMASFGSVTSAMECAIALQRAFASHTESMPEPLHVRVGLNAGEPIEEDGDLFGATVILASRIAAKAGAGEILVPDTVRGLLSGKGFMFGDRGEFVPKGFDEGVRLWDVRWRE